MPTDYLIGYKYLEAQNVLGAINNILLYLKSVCTVLFEYRPSWDIQQYFKGESQRLDLSVDLDWYRYKLQGLY